MDVLNNPIDPAEPVLPGTDDPAAEQTPSVPDDSAGEPAVEAPEAVALAREIDDLTEQLAVANRRVDEIAAIARRQSDMVDELHSENRTLRAGEVREAVAPLVRGLARLADDLSRMQSGDGAHSADLSFLDGRVAELMHDCGVLPERPEIGSLFDPQIHQATGSATTDDPAANRTIAELRRAGLRRDDGRMLRPADVVVYRYLEPEPAAADEPESDVVDSVVEEEVA